MVDLDEDRIQDFRNRVFTFYHENGRDLPWRDTTDPYSILVSEVMLQQTQVSRVIPKYEEWIDRWPTAEDLAAANLQNVLSLWKGLGYNNRAKRLRNAAQMIVEEYDGKVPRDVEELQELPGVGPYTANAIRIFADNADRATVDANIRRVLIHEFDLDEDISDDELYDVAEQVLPEGRSREWHNALMDYGAMEKTSRETGISPKTTQSSFEGSRRYYRGRILDALLEEPRKKEWLEQEIDTDEVEDILQDLQDEGMIAQDGAEYRIDQ
ncbi:MAG: Fe-S cluster assembly protein HesB [Candidatus Nanohaloarchaea archaeon]|nr:Fe-S cluster assembly protein HesB [Candidatus Nanohaloarchaea archaeon]